MKILKSEIEENENILFKDAAIDTIIDMQTGGKILVIPFGIKYVVIGGLLRYRVNKKAPGLSLECTVLKPTFKNNVITKLVI